MSIVNAAGEITSLSISQVEKADEKQTGGCLRKWWFEVPQGLKPEQTYAKNEGTAGHELLRRYLLTGENPKGRTLMGKAVTGAILKGGLPTPGDDLIVERRFSGQEMRDQHRCECGHFLTEHDGKGCTVLHVHRELKDQTVKCTCTDFRPAWIPLDIAETLHLAGVPWDGAIDLVHRRGKRPVVLDHKFSSDPETYAKQPSELIRTVQMPVYAFSQIPYYPDATEFELVHHYVSKRGVLSFMRRAVVSVDQIRERVADVVAVVERMRSVTLAKDQDDVPAVASEARCGAWNGCAHQSICSAFKRFQSNTHQGVRTMALTAEEQAMFDSIPMADAAPALPTAAPPVEVDEDAADRLAAEALAAQLAAAQQALVEKQAKRRMKIVDVDPALAATVPPPAPAPETTADVTCACGEKLTPENGSKLQNGVWKHIGCKLTGTTTGTPPAPKQRKKAEAPPPIPGSTPPATTKIPGESASERAATAAMDAARVKPAADPIPSTAEPMPPALREVFERDQKARHAAQPMAAALTQATSDNRGAAVADVLESIARLLRAA